MNQHLQFIADRNDLSPCAVMAEGILWADQSCRISGTLSLALRRCDKQSIDAILAMMITDNCTTMADACHWLNTNYSTVLETCKREV